MRCISLRGGTVTHDRLNFFWLEVKDLAVASAGYAPKEHETPTPKETVVIAKETLETPLGLSFAVIRDRVIFATVAEGSIVQKAGIRVGDQLCSINGLPPPPETNTKSSMTARRGVDTAKVLKACVGDITVEIQRGRAEVPSWVAKNSLKPQKSLDVSDSVGRGGAVGCCAVM